MIPVSFSVRLHILLPRRFCVSLPQSFVAAKRQQNPAPSEEGAEGAPAPCVTDFPYKKIFPHLNIFDFSVHNNIDVFSLPYFFIANSPEATASGLFAFAPRLLRSQKKLLKLY